MNDTMSLLLATTVLAISGVGIYLYKSNNQDTENDNENENDIYHEKGSNKDNELEKEPSLEEEYDVKVIKNKNGKTKRNKKNIGSKRRYDY